ncbi:hypothetical protein MTR_3g061730 [Medicago truncatula]|uniref:Uncharacterized protein n=1 Tax=Medicago truncatula TaxID=3880 RepID=G7J275_MEDTR|nr:hypothetical protein MTR_3g061730 [Medicago truncatula]
MENSVFDPNTKIHNDVTLFGLKSQLNQINLKLNYRDTRRVDGVEYRRPSIDSARSVRFTWMKTHERRRHETPPTTSKTL